MLWMDLQNLWHYNYHGISVLTGGGQPCAIECQPFAGFHSKKRHRTLINTTPSSEEELIIEITCWGDRLEWKPEDRGFSVVHGTTSGMNQPTLSLFWEKVAFSWCCSNGPVLTQQNLMCFPISIKGHQKCCWLWF